MSEPAPEPEAQPAAPADRRRAVARPELAEPGRARDALGRRWVEVAGLLEREAGTRRLPGEYRRPTRAELLWARAQQPVDCPTGWLSRWAAELAGLGEDASPGQPSPDRQGTPAPTDEAKLLAEILARPPGARP